VKWSLYGEVRKHHGGLQNQKAAESNDTSASLVLQGSPYSSSSADVGISFVGLGVDVAASVAEQVPAIQLSSSAFRRVALAFLAIG
jgi:hypothetical protein